MVVPMLFFTRETIPAESIELYDGFDWQPIENVDEYALREYTVQNTKVIEDDDETYTEFDPDMLLPPDLHIGI